MSIVSGPIPDVLDERLVRRDTSPLRPGELLRVQAISREKDPSGNVRYVIMDSGEVFEGRHSPGTGDWQTPFDLPMGDRPVRKVGGRSVKKLRKLLDERFSSEPPYQADPTVEGGVFMVVRGRTSQGEHEVIFDAVRPPILAEIIKLAWD